MFMAILFLKTKKMGSWPGGSAGQSAIPYTKKVAGLIPIEAVTGGNWWMFLSHIDVSPSLPLPFSLKSIDIFSGEVKKIG